MNDAQSSLVAPLSTNIADDKIRSHSADVMNLDTVEDLYSPTPPRFRTPESPCLQNLDVVMQKSSSISKENLNPAGDLYSASPTPTSSVDAPDSGDSDTPMFGSSSDMQISRPPSPALSITSILEFSEYRGEDPAPNFEYFTFSSTPHPSLDPTNWSRSLYTDSVVDLMSSAEEAGRWQLKKNPQGSRYRQDEEHTLWLNIDLKTSGFEAYDQEVGVIVSKVNDCLQSR